MGDLVGVHDDRELKGLSKRARDEIKKQVLKQLQSNAKIRRIINRNPTILTSTNSIHKELRSKLRPMIKRLKKKK